MKQAINMSIFKSFLMSMVLLGTGVCAEAQQRPSTKPAKTVTAASQRRADTVTSIKTMPELYGRYNIYAGAQHTYIGHFFLLPNGMYKVALSSDEEQYGSGQYKLSGDPVTIEWTEGLFRHNRWTGKINWLGGAPARLVFSSLVYADKDPSHSR
jgi:hypothetical protein